MLLALPNFGPLDLTVISFTNTVELPPCSENELTSCSLQVLNAAGSPGRTLLARLADRSCSLDFLLRCLMKMDHQEAMQLLTAAGKNSLKSKKKLYFAQLWCEVIVMLAETVGDFKLLNSAFLNGKDYIHLSVKRELCVFVCVCECGKVS